MDRTKVDNSFNDALGSKAHQHKELYKKLSSTPSLLHIYYVGSRKGMEKAMIEKLGIPYKGILCGKLRRYFSFQNFIDWFKIPVGIIQSLFFLGRIRPAVVFCKGGYVSFPVAVAAWMLRVPVVLHESDVQPGLANKLTSKLVTKICVSFEESRKFFPEHKTIVTGNPIRPDILTGSKEKALEILGRNQKTRPTLLVMGGSLGALFINKLVWENLEKLLAVYDVIHICGQAHLAEAEKYKTPSDANLGNKPGYGMYRPFDFVDKEFKHLYALADVVVSRAGAISLAELGALGKPALLIPLGTAGSRGEQLTNAQAFVKNHNAILIKEPEITAKDFLEALERLLKSGFAASISPKNSLEANDKIIKVLEEFIAS